MKKFYVATTFPSSSSVPSSSNAIDFLQADVLARYHRQQQAEVFFGIGVDEHGTTIAAKSKDLHIDPQAYATKLLPVWQDFSKKFNISYSHFLRTTTDEHQKAVQFIWTQLKEYIYKGTYEGLYCADGEKFVTAKEATTHNGVCPIHQKPYQRLSEENYFFKLSAFGGQIKQALQAGELKIVPKFHEHEISKLIESGLEDVSISRPKRSLSWGVQVPQDDQQIIAVWFEALMGYITMLGYPEGQDYQTFWPADAQVIGKNMLRFHAIVWPALLIALDIPLPKVLLVHGQLLNKSDSAADPIEIATTYGVDAFRYYFLRHIPTLDDGIFTWETFEAAYNNELANDLGNAVQRIASMANHYQEGVLGDVPRPKHDTGPFHEEMRKLRFDRALDYIWMKIRELNVYLEEVKPWEVIKDNDIAHLQEVLAHGVATLQQIAVLLWPFLPQTSETITRIFDGNIVHEYKGVLFPKIHAHTPQPDKVAP